MKTTLARWLRALLVWLEPAAPLVLVVVKDALYFRAVALVTQHDTALPAPGFGEAKRHQVYAKLIKEFPTRAKRDLAKAIEAAL